MTFFMKNKTKIDNNKSNDTIMTHKKIVMFLENIDNERFYIDSINPERKTLQKKIGVNEEIKRHKREISSLNKEDEIQNQLNKDRKHQDLNQQIQTKEHTAMIKHSQIQIQEQLVNKLIEESKKKEEKITLSQKEIKEKEKIIRDIQEQLNKKKTWIIENNHFTEQLSREFEQNNRLLSKTQEELIKKNKELNISKKELQEIKEENDDLLNEIFLRNKIIETIKKQFEEQDTLLLGKTQQIKTLQSHSKSRNTESNRQKQHLQENVDAFKIEVKTRNKIIENIQKQLMQNQLMQIEHTNTNEQIQEELNWSKQLLQKTQNTLEEKQRDLVSKENELLTQGLQCQKVCADLDMLRSEIDSRNRIIENIEKQLVEEQTNLIEKIQLVEHFETELENKQKKIEKQSIEINNIQISLGKKEQKIIDLKTELKDRLNDLEFRNNDLNAKIELINQLEKNLENSLQEVKEKNIQLLANKQELKELHDELNQTRINSQKKWIDFVLANIEIRDDRKQIEELNLKLEHREKILQESQSKLQQITQEFTTKREIFAEKLETLNKEITIRSKVLNEIEKQLADKQMLLTEKTLLVETLQTDLATKNNELNTRIRKHEEAQGNINSLQTAVITRNHIINILKRQLIENQTGFLEKTSFVEQQCEKFKQQQNFIKEIKTELVRKNNELLSYRQEIEEKDSGLQHLRGEMNKREKDLEITQQEIFDLMKQFQGMFSKLKTITTSSEPIIKMLENQLLERTSSLNVLKKDQFTLHDEKKSYAGDIEHIIINQQENMNHFIDDNKLKEKLQISNDVEKCLHHTFDDHLKTKKSKNEELK